MSGLNTGTSGRLHPSSSGNRYRIIAWILTAPILLAVIGWETLAVYYSNLPDGLRLPGAIAIALISLHAALYSSGNPIHSDFFLCIFNCHYMVLFDPAFQ